MASRVNVKFVLILAISLVAVSGVVGYVGLQALKKSGAELAAMGDEQMAAENYREAARLYQRAVSRDQTQVEWLAKWREALLHIVPETRVNRQKYYTDFYRGILRQLAVLQPENIEAQEQFLQTLIEELRVSDSGPQDWQALADAADDAIERAPQDDPNIGRLHRYRGLAGLRRIAQVEESEASRQQVLEDLQRAVEADPSDIASALGVLQWRVMEWRRALRTRRTETASTRWDEVLAELESLRERFPNDPRVEIDALRARLDRAMAVNESPAERIEWLREMREEDIAARLVGTLAEADVSDMDHRFVTRMLPVLKMLRPDDGDQILLDTCDRILEARSDDARVRLIKGGVLSDMERYEDAIAEHQRIVEMPERPVSLQALLLDEYQNRALVEQARAYLEIARRAETDEARAAAIEQAKATREEVVERVAGGAGAPSALLVDGEIAMMEGRYEAAVRYLTELDRITAGTEMEVIRLLGDALFETGTLGGAREQYERILASNPFDIRALLAAAEVDRRLRDVDSAILRLQTVLRIVPGNQQAIGILQALRAQRGELPEAIPSDPVMAALVRAEALRNRKPPDVDAARQVLDEALEEHPDNVRLMTGRIQLELQNGDPALAEDLVATALERFPEEEQFQRWGRQLALRSSESPVDAVLTLIDESEGSQIQKLAQRYDVLHAAGREEEADATLDEAADMAPDDPSILERRFIRALEDNDLQQARTLAERASATNADQADGALFQARLDLMEDESEAALSTLEGVVDRLPFNPLAWRLLGQTYLQVGRPDAAIDALARAYNFRPDDRRTARLYIRALTTLQRPAEALDVARASRERHPADREIRELWLQLEEAKGDIEVALNTRLSRYEDDPQDLDNTLSLVRLLASEERYSEAAQYLEKAKEQAPNDLSVVLLEARVAAAEGDVEGGETRLRQFIEGRGDDAARADGYRALSDYLSRFGDSDGALAALEQAATLSGEDQTQAQWDLAQGHRRAGNLEESLRIFAELANGDGPRAEAALLQEVDLLIQLDRFDDALERLAATAPANGSPSVDRLLLQARAAAGAGNPGEASQLLNQAIEAAPNDARPFLRRAQLHARDTEQFADVMADLDQAIRLQPGLLLARQLKAALLTRAGREGEAIAEFRSLVELYPERPDVHALLLRQLVELERYSEAQAAADAASRIFEDDPTWLRWAGDLYAEVDQWGAAAQRFQTLYEMASEPRNAVRLAQALLSKSRAEPERAREILLEHWDEETSNPFMTILVARASVASGDPDEAVRLASLSLSQLETPDELRTWWEEAQKMFDSPLVAAAFLERQEPPAGLENIFTVLTAKQQAADPRRRGQVISDLRGILEDVEHEATLVDLHRLLGELLYAEQRYAEAVEVYERACELAPNELEFNNNLAYLQAKHMDNAEAALAPAQRAAELAPADASVLDTLGWVYYRLGRLGQARATLGKALDAAATDQTRLPTYLHLAQTALAEGDRPQAERHARRAEEILNRLGPAYVTEYRTDLQTLMRELNQAE